MVRAGVLLVACVLSCAGSVLAAPPRGPWRGSSGAREQAQALQAGERPLVERCTLRWRDTELDHFR